jgi:UDP-N-acetylglucosamine--N-acetylmuramyl-(pentapeptide) pyrophosphoryl-undecaprenol N-acetylglucosamine transferase
MKLLVCAGGTGGGIYPALAAVSALRERAVPTDHILWVGTKGEMEEKLVPREGLNLTTIRGGAIAGVSLPKKVINGAKLAWSVGTAVSLVRRFQPNVMFMTGGYMAAPVTIACRLLGVPIVIYLPDVEPGASIRFAVRHAAKIAATTDGSAQYVPVEKLVVTGYPVRPELRAATQLSKAEALSQFNLTPDRPTLFVFGGSRGAWAINQALMTHLPALLEKAQIIHISGTLTWDKVAANAETLPPELRRYYRPYPYLHGEMGAAFRSADLVLSRAGASMLGEAPAFGVPAILTPLTWAWRYQKVNADYLTDRGAAVQLTDDRLVDELLPTVTDLLFNRERLAAMAAASKALDVPDAVDRLADVITAVARQKEGVTA